MKPSKILSISVLIAIILNYLLFAINYGTFNIFAWSSDGIKAWVALGVVMMCIYVIGMFVLLISSVTRDK